MPKKTYTGINIQWPISSEILNGEKTVETRTYPIPEKYLGEDILIIETPGKHGMFKSRIVAIARFVECIQYKNEADFYKDSKRHKVKKGSIWDWKDKPKYGWKVEIIKKITPPLTFKGRKGIIYTNGIKI